MRPGMRGSSNESWVAAATNEGRALRIASHESSKCSLCASKPVCSADSIARSRSLRTLSSPATSTSPAASSATVLTSPLNPSLRRLRSSLLASLYSWTEGSRVRRRSMSFATSRNAGGGMLTDLATASAFVFCLECRCNLLKLSFDAAFRPQPSGTQRLPARLQQIFDKSCGLGALSGPQTRSTLQESPPCQTTPSLVLSCEQSKYRDALRAPRRLLRGLLPPVLHRSEMRSQLNKSGK